MDNSPLICLNAVYSTRNEAIRAVGKMLVAAGAVSEFYIESMLKREAAAHTWLGGGIAIPHGILEDKSHILADKVALLQVPQGVEWLEGKKAHLIFGIAARGQGHLDILRRIAQLLQRPDKLQDLFFTKDAAFIKAVLSAHTDEMPGSAAAKDLDFTEKWQLDYPNGLHARPSSAWIEAARQSGIAIQVRKGNAVSDIKSLASLLGLGAKCKDELVFSASGAQAEEKLAIFMRAVRRLSSSEKQQAEKAEEQKRKILSGGWKPSSGLQPVIGAAASPGLAIGTLYRIFDNQEPVEDESLPPEESGAILQAALEKTNQQIQAAADDTARRIGLAEAEILKAQLDWLKDEGLITQTCRLILEGKGPAKAWDLAVKSLSSQISNMDNPLLAARSADLQDIGRRALGNIDRRYALNSLDNLPADKKSIIIAEDLSPSIMAKLDSDHVCGLATSAGGASSHMAILARTMGIPALTGAGMALAEAKNGDLAIINGDTGALWVNPGAEDIAEAQAKIFAIQEKQQAESERRLMPATTPDGHTIAIAANINRPNQVAFALDQGAEGVGLMRTEFLFLESNAPPDEESQYETYKAMAAALNGRQLIIRALDIGGDKQVPYLHLPREENPFLGVRGSRLLLQRDNLLYPQLRAVYRAAKAGCNVAIMFPMIMSVGEVIQLKHAAAAIRSGMAAPEIPFGIMVEIPSAALCADILSQYVDFFSIGTNDLTQYTLALDRQNENLAVQADSFNPAILRMIKLIVAGAKLNKCPVGVCGGLAAEPAGAVLLAGLGVDELSMAPRDIAAVKERLRETPFSAMKDLAEKACGLKNGAEVRALFETGE